MLQSKLHIGLAAMLTVLAFQLCAAGPAVAARLVPLFPDQRSGLTVVEAEDALSTNMASEPTLVYGCSGDRALQCSRTSQLRGGEPYYVDFAVFVDAAGSYQLWYGGTPPGPRDQYAPSYFSPLTVALDGGNPKPLYREDVTVAAQYSPTYYWVKTPALDLSAGADIIRFAIAEPRRVDKRYVFNIDLVLLATADALAAATPDELPPGFNTGGGAAPSDIQIRSLEDYQSFIASSPTSLAAYASLADDYSLIGDYLNALKTLSRALVVAPDKPEFLLLSAKNRLWRGDVREGLDMYRRYIAVRHDDIHAYEEAGKVAAWSGQYAESEEFYREGLAVFPADLSLLVNLGLAQLWASQGADAQKSFGQAEALALTKPELTLRLASIYKANGYPEKSIALLDQGRQRFPDQLDLYFSELSILSFLGRTDAVAALEKAIEDSFQPSDRLTALLTEEKERIDLKSQRLAALEARIAATPEELGLREELVRAYFWNGYRAKAAAALEDILAARFVLSLDASDTEGKALLSAEVLGAALAAEADRHSASLAASLRVAAGAAQSSAKAAADLAAWRKTADAASQAGKPEPAGGDTLAAARVSADEAWATSLAALSDELARAAALTDAVASLKKASDSATAADETARTSFKTLSTPSKWRFDTASALASLQDSAGRGESMARLGMARLYLASGDYKSASGALGGIGADALRSRRAALTVELTARQGGQDLLALVQKSGDELSLAPAGSELSAALGGIESATAAHNLPAAPASDAALPERESYRAALSQLFESLSHDADAAKASALESRTQSLAVAQTLARRSDERVERAWYGFESDSLDRISELGSYYDGLGRSAAAIAEYRRVLSIDPSNLQAMFQLALAADKIGDWAVAAPLLWKVNAADPYFGNAAARYNVIARQHAETYEADAQSFADLNYLEYRARASVEYPFTSLLSIKPSFTAELLRDRYLDQYTPSPAFLVEEAAIAAPTTLVRDSSRSLILTPHVSLLGTSTQYIPTSQSPLSPSEFVRTLSGFTAAGIDADWKAGAWQGQATYSYAPLPYSLNPVLEPLYTHKVELSGGGYLPLGAPFRYFAPRVYLSGSYVPDDMNNMFGTALLELIPALRLSDSPWANLGFPVDLIYEGSTISRTSPYYAADQALTAKGGLLWQSTFTTQSGQALSLSLQAQGGLYEDALLSSSPNSYPDASLFFRLDWIREFVTYWVSVELTGANPFAANPDYWSLSIMGGVSARQPKLISP